MSDFIHNRVAFKGFVADKKKFRKALRALGSASGPSEIYYNLRTGSVSVRPLAAQQTDVALTSSALCFASATDASDLTPTLLYNHQNRFYMVPKGAKFDYACWNEVIQALAPTHVLASGEALVELGLDLFEAVLYPKS